MVKKGNSGDPTSIGQKIGRFLRGISFHHGGDASLKESLEEVIEEHDEQQTGGKLGNDERSMLFNVLNYGELRLDDIMVPRADIVALEDKITIKGLTKAFAEAAHSRFPIYRRTLDEVLGFIHVKDVIKAINEPNGKEAQSAKYLLRPVLFVAPSMKLIDLLAKMKLKRTHMAIVVDEYGGTDGLVTIEDLVEQIVGEIEDEHDVESSPKLVKIADNIYEADARLPLEELEAILNCDLLPDERDEDINTLGGLVISLEGRVPAIGERVSHVQGFIFEILDADVRRLKTLRIIVGENGQ